MAYAALVSLVHTLDQLLFHHQSFLDNHKKKQIQSVHDKAVLLSTFLEDFPTEGTKLEARITVAANEVEDIFEYHILDKILGSKHGNASICFPSLLMLYTHKINKEYFAIREIKSLLKEAMKMKSMCTSENQIMPSSTTPAHRVVNVHGLVVGFEKDLREIQERLHHDSANLEVIPIVGMGGIGKTTLARYALHHPLNLEHFDVSGWVSISQNYDKPNVLLSLLKSIDASSKLEHSDNESLLQERIYRYLKGRRFLIVIDDIWNSQPWDDLRRVFPDDFNGSRIIITTRDTDVACYVESSSHPYEMHLMDVELSWNLLRRKVFEEEQCSQELEEIGRQIAEKCRGLPLAIVMISGVLSKVSRTQDAWRKIAINVSEAVSASDEPFMEILSLSYSCLPHHLKPCFLYIGGFPEDHEIHISELIRMWVAEGFLKPNGSKDMEKVGEDYLEDLAKRSLVLINKKRYNGRIKSIKMHDLLRDLCLRKAADEKFLNVIHERRGSVSPLEKSRRISFLSNVKDHFLNMDDSSIHTILAFNNASFASWKRCRLLRVVNLAVGDMRLLDRKIGDLLHLRYFAIAFEDYGNPKVVEYFSSLVNLQTLIIGRPWCSFKLYLPLGIWRMRELRHVIVFDGLLPDPETNCEDDTLPLQNLHTLKRILDFRCSKGVLKLIPNLKKLGITYSQTRLSKFHLNNLVHLQRLEKLNIHADLHDHIKGALSDWLAFPMTLKKLTLGGTQIPWEEMSNVGSLPNLQVLKLKRRACSGSEWKTNEGEFCQLKLLVIHSTDPNVWITESSHFPRLEHLTLRSCKNLREIPGDIGDISTLQLIEVMRCTQSVVESAKCIEEEQHSYGNYILQLHLDKLAHS